MILHLDLDCFFASAHRIHTPKLHNIPIAVGGRSNLNIFEKQKQSRQMSLVGGAFTSSIVSSNQNKSYKEYFVDSDGKIRGIITTASYEARAYGVKTAMPVSQALRLCPTLKVLAPNYPLYHKLSNELRLLLEKEIPSIEQFSIDEFFGDISGWIDEKQAIDFAKYLQKEILNRLKLPISIGIANTKWIAKLATNDAKPHGVFFVPAHEVENYIQDKPIACFPGIGKKYQEKLSGHGIATLGDVKKRKKVFESLGKYGTQLYYRILGLDNEKISHKEDKKSLGLSRTFDPELNRYEIRRRLVILVRHLCFIALKSDHRPATYSLSIKYQYGLSAKDSNNANRIFNEQYTKEVFTKLFDKIDTHKNHAIVKISIHFSNFQNKKNTTYDLFCYEQDTKQSHLSNSMQKLREKFGIDIIKSGSEL